MSKLVSISNSEIRSKARKLCGQNFSLLLSASFLSVVIRGLFEQVPQSGDPAVELLCLPVKMIAEAMLVLGTVRIALDIWHGRKASLSALFRFKRTGTYIFYSLLIELIVIGIAAGVAFVVWIADILPDVLTWIVVVTVVVLGVILALWMLLRFALTGVCIVVRPELDAVDCMRASWRASKGNLWRLFCNVIIVCLPAVLAAVIFNAARRGYINTYGLAVSTSLAYSFITSAVPALIATLFLCYACLAMFPLYEMLILHDNSDFTRIDDTATAADGLITGSITDIDGCWSALPDPVTEEHEDDNDPDEDEYNPDEEL